MASLKNFKVDQGLDVNGIITANSISATTIDAKLAGAALDSPTFTGTVTVPTLTVGQGGFSAPNFGDVTSDEIQQLDGVTSNIQQQLNSKASIAYVDNAVANVGGGGGNVDLTSYAKKNNPEFTVDSEIVITVPLSNTVIYFNPNLTQPGIGNITFSNISTIDYRLSSLPQGAIVTFGYNYQEQSQIKPWAGKTFKIGGVASDGNDSKGYGLQYIDSIPAGIEYGQLEPDPDQYITISYTGSSIVSTAELKNLDGVTTNIQTQLDSKVNNINPTFTVKTPISIQVPVVEGSIHFGEYGASSTYSLFTIYNPDATDGRLWSLKPGDTIVFNSDYKENGVVKPWAGKTFKILTEGIIPAANVVDYKIEDLDLVFNPGISGPWSPDANQFITINSYEINTISSSEIKYLDGINQNIKTGLTSKASRSNPEFTIGTPQVELLNENIHPQGMGGIDYVTYANGTADITVGISIVYYQPIYSVMTGINDFVNNYVEISFPGTSTPFATPHRIISSTFGPSQPTPVITVEYSGPSGLTGSANNPLTVITSGQPQKTISSAEIGYLDGLTGNIQTQINSISSGGSVDLSSYVTKTSPEFSISNGGIIDIPLWNDDQYLFPYNGPTATVFELNATNPGYQNFINWLMQNETPTTSIIDPTQPWTVYSTDVTISGITPSSSNGTWITGSNAVEVWENGSGTSIWIVWPISYENATYNNPKMSYGVVKTISKEEVSYLDGLTSNIQTQLNSKASSVNPEFIISSTENVFWDGNITTESSPTLGAVNIYESNGKTIYSFDHAGGIFDKPIYQVIKNIDYLGQDIYVSAPGTSFTTFVKVLQFKDTGVDPNNYQPHFVVDTPIAIGTFESGNQIVIKTLNSSETISKTEFKHLNGINSNIQAQLDEKASSIALSTQLGSFANSRDAKQSVQVMIDAALEPDVSNYLYGNVSSIKPVLGGAFQGHGTRVLITNTAADGIYYLEKNAAGNFYFTYPTDADPTMGYLTNGAFTFVEEGTHAGKGYVVSNGQWKQFSANQTSGVWQEYTPKLYINDSAHVDPTGYYGGRYTKIGKTVHFKIVVNPTNIDPGQNGTPWSFSLPSAPSIAHSGTIVLSGHINNAHPILYGQIASGPAGRLDIYPQIMNYTSFSPSIVTNGYTYDTVHGAIQIYTVDIVGTYEEA